MLEYQLVAPESFSSEQNLFIQKFKKTIALFSFRTQFIFGAKDIESRHLIATDAYAKIVGLSHGAEVGGKFDDEMPCEGTVQFAAAFVESDIALFDGRNIYKKVSKLCVHEYADGLKARLFDKYPLKHHASQSILGLIYTAQEINISQFLALVPNYLTEFGMGCELEGVHRHLVLGDVTLTDYEHEICFLLTLNWSNQQIADFLNQHRPAAHIRGPERIDKYRERICRKLKLALRSDDDLRVCLIHMGVHKKIPKLFFSRLVGPLKMRPPLL